MTDRTQPLSPRDAAATVALMAYRLQEDPRFAELERSVGRNAANGVVAEAAAGFWNADLTFSRGRLKDTAITMDDTNLAQAKSGVYSAVEAAAKGKGLGVEAITRIAADFFTRLTSFEKQSLALSPAAFVPPADLGARVASEAQAAKEAGQRTSASENTAATLFNRIADYVRQQDARSGSRYDTMTSESSSIAASETDWSSPVQMARTRALATRLGVGWVSNNAELLRQGPELVRLIAKTQLREDSYKAFKKVGTARDLKSTLTFSDHAKVDANDYTRAFAETFKYDDPETSALKRQFLAAQEAYNRDRTPNAAQAMEDSAKKVEAIHPESAKAVGTITKAVEQAKAVDAGAASTNTMQSTSTSSKTAAADDLLLGGVSTPEPSKPAAAKPAPARPLDPRVM